MSPPTIHLLCGRLLKCLPLDGWPTRSPSKCWSNDTYVYVYYCLTGLHRVVHMCQTQGPGAKSGPRPNSIQPMCGTASPIKHCKSVPIRRCAELPHHPPTHGHIKAYVISKDAYLEYQDHTAISKDAYLECQDHMAISKDAYLEYQDHMAISKDAYLE